MSDRAIQIAWGSDPAMADQLARFFAKNVTPDYISHEELQGPRAIELGRWRPDLVDIVRVQISDRIAQSRGRIEGAKVSRLVVVARDGNHLIGLALVSFFPNAATPYGTVDDIVVDERYRGSGIGEKLMRWIMGKFHEAGISRFFLERGIGNNSAHSFFERLGFKQISVVMMGESDRRRAK